MIASNSLTEHSIKAIRVKKLQGLWELFFGKNHDNLPSLTVERKKPPKKLVDSKGFGVLYFI